jgi:hypothetical protein
VDDSAARARPEQPQPDDGGPDPPQGIEGGRTATELRQLPCDERSDEHRSGLARHAWWLAALGALVVSKALSTSVVILETLHRGTIPIVGPVRPLTPLGPQGSITVWNTAVSGARGALGAWDGLWYLAAAEHGWAAHPDTSLPNTTGFFPAVPLTIRWAHDLLGTNWTQSGLLATSVLEVAAALAIAYLARLMYGDRVAIRAVTLVVLFPGAYVFALIYSEPLFLLAAAGCLIFLRRRQWVLAGLAGALAGATRSTGFVLCVACAWVALGELRKRPWRHAWRSLAAPVLAPLGTAAYLVFLWVRTGSPNTYDRSQADAWGQRTSFLAIVKVIGSLPHEVAGLEAWVGVLFLGLATLALVLLALQVKRGLVPSEWLIFSVGIVASCLTSAQLSGLRPRFALTAFPLLIGLAIRLRGWLFALVASVFTVGLGLMAWTLPLYVP